MPPGYGRNGLHPPFPPAMAVGSDAAAHDPPGGVVSRGPGFGAFCGMAAVLKTVADDQEQVAAG